MSKRKPSKESKLSSVCAGEPRTLVSIALVLSLIVTAVALANRDGSGAITQRSKEKKSGEITIASFSAGSPSKEYVYAGSRLVATEECSYSISPVDAFYSQAGAEGIVDLTAGSGCSWTVGTSDPDWITITSATSGSGSDVISYLVRDNDTGSARQGTLTIAGLSFTVTQDGGLGEDCAYAISPLFKSFNASGGSGGISVFAEERCAWQAVSNASWVTITSGCCGVGNGTVNYSVAPNTGSGRDATITIADKTFNVKQKAN